MRRRHAGVGFTLVEALVALAMLAFGIVALAGLQLSVGRQSAAVRERMQATRHAQQAIEQARSFDALVAASGASAPGFGAFDGLVDGASVEAAPSLRAGFTVDRRWIGDTDAPWRELVVSVSWKDRLGRHEAVDLRTVLARSEPTRLAGASLQAPVDPALRPMARHPAIPLHAVRRGDGTSALPWTDGHRWLIIDDLSAEVVGICEASVAAGSATTAAGAASSASASLDAADPSRRDPKAAVAAATGNPLQSCLATSGYLLSGYIGVYDGADRTSAAAPPAQASTAADPAPDATTSVRPPSAAPSAAVLPPDLAVAFTQAEFIVGVPTCAPMVTVANAPGHALDRPRFYICLVRPSDHDRRADTPMVWSARVNLWSANGLAGRTVCRYSKDAQTKDNQEHPDTYRLVAVALHNQNFVVTTPGSDCPAGTVLHQRL